MGNKQSEFNTDPFCYAIEQGDLSQVKNILNTLNTDEERLQQWTTPINGFTPIFWLGVRKIDQLPAFYTISTCGLLADGSNFIMDDIDNINLDKFVEYEDPPMVKFAKKTLSELPGYLKVLKAESDENGIIKLSEKNITRVVKAEIRIVNLIPKRNEPDTKFPGSLKVKDAFLLNTDKEGKLRITYKPNIFGVLSNVSYGAGLIEFVVCADLNFKLHYDMTDDELIERDIILHNKVMSMNLFQVETDVRLKTKTQDDPANTLFYQNIVDEMPIGSKRKVRKNSIVNVYVDDLNINETKEMHTDEEKDLEKDQKMEKTKAEDKKEDVSPSTEEEDKKEDGAPPTVAEDKNKKEDSVLPTENIEKSKDIKKVARKKRVKRKSIIVEKVGECVVNIEKKHIYLTKVGSKKFDEYQEIYYRRVSIDLTKTKRIDMKIGDLVSYDLQAGDNKEKYQFKIKSLSYDNINNSVYEIVLEDIKGKQAELKKDMKKLLLFDEQPGLYTNQGRILYFGDI